MVTSINAKRVVQLATDSARIVCDLSWRAPSSVISGSSFPSGYVGFLLATRTPFAGCLWIGGYIHWRDPVTSRRGCRPPGKVPITDRIGGGGGALCPAVVTRPARTSPPPPLHNADRPNTPLPGNHRRKSKPVTNGVPVILVRTPQLKGVKKDSNCGLGSNRGATLMSSDCAFSAGHTHHTYDLMPITFLRSRMPLSTMA